MEMSWIIQLVAIVALIARTNQFRWEGTILALVGCLERVQKVVVSKQATRTLSCSFQHVHYCYNKICVC